MKHVDQKADSSMVLAVKESRFSPEEQTSFWKRKWMREHILWLVMFGDAVIGLFIWAWCWDMPWLAGACALLCMIGYITLRNPLMIYVENKIYMSKETENHGYAYRRRR